MLEAETFFEQNRKYKKSIDQLCDPNQSNEKIAKWILKSGHSNWLHLNLTVPVDDFLKDEEFAQLYYVNHRDIETGEGTHQGWHSCTLHGISTEKTNHWSIYGYQQEPKYSWTELGQKTTHIQSFCKTLPFERLDRVRFMKLQPDGHISPHDDNSNHIDWDNLWSLPLPINIAIDHPANCFMTVKQAGVVPFRSGDAYLVNILKTHSVINFSHKDRKHIIVHGIVGNCKDQYCKLLADSYRKQYEKIHSQIQ